MTNKDRYYALFKENEGQMNEIALGETIGLDEAEVLRILSQLLSEYKVEYAPRGASNYSLMQVARRIRQRKF